MKQVFPVLYSPEPWLQVRGHDKSIGSGCRATALLVAADRDGE